MRVTSFRYNAGEVSYKLKRPTPMQAVAGVNVTASDHSYRTNTGQYDSVAFVYTVHTGITRAVLAYAVGAGVVAHN